MPVVLVVVGIMVDVDDDVDDDIDVDAVVDIDDDVAGADVEVVAMHTPALHDPSAPLDSTQPVPSDSAAPL